MAYSELPYNGNYPPGVTDNDPYFDDDEPNEEYCELCGGMGIIITCVDDLCANEEECIHGDGETPCPNGCD